MSNSTTSTDIVKHFSKNKLFTTKDVLKYFRSLDPHAKRSTINWITYNLVKKGLLQRIGRGIFVVSEKNTFIPVLKNKEKTIANKLHKQFPFLSFCIWHVSLLSEFFQHWPDVNFTLMETERDSVDSVFNFLKETNQNVYKEPTKDFIQDYIVSLKNAIIVKPLTTEAPLIKDKNYQLPQLEKIIVDLYTDNNLFYFIEGQELTNVLINIISKYAINYDKLSRYASRRGKKEEISKLIKQLEDKE